MPGWEDRLRHSMLLGVNERDDWTRLRIHADDAGQRLDRFLRKLLPGCALGQIFKFLRKGRIRLGEGKAGPELRLEEGQEVCFRIPPAELEAMGLSLRACSGESRQGEPGQGPSRKGSGGAAGAGEIRPVFEDEDILAVDKPAGLPVHGGTGHEGDDLGRRVRAALAASASAGAPHPVSHTFTPGPAHRLDRETSGLVLFGKTARGLRALSELLREKRVEKFYLALLGGELARDSGRLEGCFREVVARRRDRPKLVPDPMGSQVDLEYRRLASHAGLTLVRVQLGTGKMHQIRAQFAAEGCPLIGDLRYGGGEPGRGVCARLSPQRFLLHCSRLVLRHPFNAEVLDLRVDPPDDVQALLLRLGVSLPSADPRSEPPAETSIE